uniref:Checkpoint protein n=2 Tax=Aegilops tauschii subsp. strangulata TaxID=200361 RepID=A0A453CGH2_AEGTS
MKFKASFTDDGISLLDKRFLPAIDKVGRVCHVYLTPTHAMLLHNLLGSTGPDGDGPQCVAQFAKDLLFREYNVSSRDGNRVAFSVDVALLHRAIRSALAVHAQSPAAGDAPAAIQVKLVNKQTPGSRSAAPFLTFETKGARSAVVQDVPISKPLSRSDVARLQDALDAAQELPETLVQVPDLQQLQNLVDRLKNIGDLLSVTVTQYGDLHLQVSTSLVTLGSEFKRLRILGARGKLWLLGAVISIQH